MSGIELGYGDTSASKVLREGSSIVTFRGLLALPKVRQDFLGSSDSDSKWQKC